MLLMDRVVGIVAPHSCLVCGRENALLCAWCKDEVLDHVPSRCYRCHAQTSDFTTCDKCRRVSRLQNLWLRTNYQGLARQLVHQLKFERAVGASRTIAELMVEALPHLPTDTIVSYVPTATNRRRQRGYDQSELIARKVADLLNKQFAQLLARHGQSRQVGASRRQRQEQLKKAFYSRRAEFIRGKQILLIDDLVTTGATLEAAAESLKKAGARRVYAATFAQRL